MRREGLRGETLVRRNLRQSIRTVVLVGRRSSRCNLIAPNWGDCWKTRILKGVDIPFKEIVWVALEDV